MGPRITLDTSLALARAVGAWGGLEHKDLRAQISRINAAHAAIVGAGDAAWPHISALAEGPALAQALRWGAARRAGGEPLVVVGEPSAVGAAMAVLGDASVRGLDSLDGFAVEAAFAGGRPPHLLVLPGPDWVIELADAVADRSSGCTVAGDAHLLSGAESLPPLSNVAFGALGPVAWALAARAGQDVAGLLAEGLRMAQRCSSPALFENPAYLLAATVLACRERGADRLALLLPVARMLPWAAWAERAWGALTARREQRAGVGLLVGTPTFSAMLADEARIAALAGGPNDVVSLALWAEDPGAHWTLRDGQPAWERTRSLHQSQVRLLAHGGRPVVQLRLPALTPGWLVALSFLTLHSALVVAMGGEGDPRVLPGVDLWRTSLRRDHLSGADPDAGVSRG